MSKDPNGGASERFGARHGLEQRGQPQDRRMDHRLRNDLWNVFYMHWPYDDEVRARLWTGWAEMTLDEFDLMERRDRIMPNHDGALRVLKNRYWEIPEDGHYRIYELVEEVCAGLEASRLREFTEDVNSALAENLSVYRLTKGRLERTMPDLEHEGVKKASRISHKNREHIEKALKHMGPTRPDYEASISESVKMVEHTAQKLGGRGIGLNSLVKSVSKRASLHPVMQEQFAQMYRFANKTSRHSEAGEEYEPDSNDAMVMLFWCSAMANYLADKAAATGAGRLGSQRRRGAAARAPKDERADLLNPQASPGRAAAANSARQASENSK